MLNFIIRQDVILKLKYNIQCDIVHKYLGKPRYEPSSVKISGRRVSCDVSRRDLDRSGLNDEEEGRFYDYDDPQYQELYSDEELSQLELDDYGEDYLENNPNDPLKTPIPKQECAVICNKLECSRGLPFSLI